MKRKKYFIHSYRDIGSKFLCEHKDGEIWVHGEYDLSARIWHPVTDAGQPYKPLKWQDALNAEYSRINIVELNRNVSSWKFNHILKDIKSYRDVR